MSSLNTAVMIAKEYSVAVMFVVFGLLMVTVWLPSRRERFEKDARIPLEDDR